MARYTYERLSALDASFLFAEEANRGRFPGLRDAFRRGGVPTRDCRGKELCTARALALRHADV